MSIRGQLYDDISQVLNASESKPEDKIEALFAVLSAISVIIGHENKKLGKKVLKIYKNKSTELLKNYDNNLTKFKENIQREEEIKRLSCSENLNNFQ